MTLLISELVPASTDCPDMHERPHINRKGFALLSFAIAVVCAAVLVMQVRDRWHTPEIRTAAEAQHTTTGQAARAAGARISQTDPKPAVEPDPAGPKPAQPAHPN
jgi:hypothetical protein